MGLGNRARGEEGEALSGGGRKTKHWRDVVFFSYFSYPHKSVDGLIDDFINKSCSRYKAAYVYFTDCKYALGCSLLTLSR